jgi:hypothetical protein
VVLATPRISEVWLMPLLESILQQFPFVILNFHSDNGSEFINKVVAELLEKLLIEQTKSRPRRSGDNGLMETKNAAIVRKHIGWGHIAPAYAAPLNQFYTGFLNPYVNYHRPAAQAEARSTPRAANGASISCDARRWKHCSRWIGHSSSCVPDSASMRSNAWPRPSATPKPHDECNRPKAPCSSRSKGRRKHSETVQADRGNDGLWKARKTMVLFSALPTNLGNRKSRFPHFHRRDQDEQHMKSSPRGAVRAARLILTLQAHSWIGKDYFADFEGSTSASYSLSSVNRDRVERHRGHFERNEGLDSGVQFVICDRRLAFFQHSLFYNRDCSLQIGQAGKTECQERLLKS